VDPDADACLAAGIASDADVDGTLVRRKESPEGGRTSMARDRTLAERKDCGDASAFKGHLRVAHCIDTAMKSI
jgi:hypothetical protein